MKRGSNFILVRDIDLNDKMPGHFTSRYGKINPDTERLNARTWGELIADPEYKAGHGGTPVLNYEGENINIIALDLRPILGDFSNDAVYKPGLEKQFPIFTVMNWVEATEFYDVNQQMD